MVSDALDDLRYTYYTLAARTDWPCGGRFYSLASGDCCDRTDYSVSPGPRSVASGAAEAARLSPPQRSCRTLQDLSREGLGGTVVPPYSAFLRRRPWIWLTAMSAIPAFWVFHWWQGRLD
jgi:hypothetical protein